MANISKASTVDVPQAIGTMYSLPSVDGGSSIDKHGMDQVIGGIEAQKEEDLNALSSYMDR
ncbi:hypothetical protein [Photobacterium sanguinicancri]|uniref:hypothetical protein n=1 Tax=Photobacterium sanguinicancri TaxID=875932 RepID=UPI00113FE681|nr:hypothetical protein [Photobacterium sanguinicancri]